MSWYAVQTMTGLELDALRAIRDLGIAAIVPMEWREERRKNAILLRPHLYVPGYVLIDWRFAAHEYHHVRAVPGVIGLIGGGTPQEIPPEQMRVMLALARHGESMRPADAAVIDGVTVITSGPLVALSPRITSVDARNGRARIVYELLGQRHTATVCINIQPAPRGA